ncbi:phospho-N-acetylmuramoyl-pentapeptide-transferase [Euzebya tangerina]|uniref:phospho-N-acetylmuramoyl-pentapeptide- transferase n=1 Tax=Euzebya tangerina TaxID=591198 RepID=UPI000E317099|nr:phospho-N-acetylmuramoyl-pentapeptide-transferase [Euzebya tangerina]
MRFILLAAAISLALSLVGTPLVIRFFRSRQMGQLIRDDGPQSHQTKRGTPTMGGTAIIIAGLVAYIVSAAFAGRLDSAGGALAMSTFAGMGLVGFLDDFIKLRQKRNLGLSKTAKFGGQALVAIVFAFGAQYVAETSTQLSFIGPLPLDFGPVLFPIFCFIILSGTSNAVNLTDGLDGLAAGVSAMVFGAYMIIAFWIFRHEMDYTREAWIHADTLAIAAAAAMGATTGFLWWNAHPAKIFMGDTGSLAIGGMLASLAVLTETELLVIILGGLFVAETVSVILQIAVFRLGGGRRLFRMAPFHHHFEQLGWHENTVIVRFWIIGGLCTAFGIGLFYAEYLSRAGSG